MSKLEEFLKILHSLSRGVRRSLKYLTSALGIIIGIACIVTTVSIIEGGKAIIYNNFGNKGLTVYEIQDEGKGGALTTDDSHTIVEKMPDARQATAVLGAQGQIASYKETRAADIFGVSEEYKKYMNIEMLKGSFIRQADNEQMNKVAVIDDVTALNLFGSKEIIGQKLEVSVSGKNVEFLVAGVFRNYNRTIENIFEEDIESICLIPESTAEDNYKGFDTEKVIVSAKKSLHEEEISGKLLHVLQKEHGDNAAFNIKKYDQLAAVSDFTDKYLAFSIAISAASLVIGCIGIMNLMLLTLSERKKEIGLYKFYGAGISEIQYGIIFKSLAVCLGFGLLGMAAGIIAGKIIGSFINVKAALTFNTMALALFTSAVAGAASGLYPAAKAASIDASKAIWGE